MANSRRPRAGVQSIVVYNDQDVGGQWIPLRLEVGSWVTLKPASTGPWARDSRRQGEESNAGAYKARIVEFQWSYSTVRGKVVMKLESVLVRHAYERRQIHLDPVVSATEPRACNYLYASYWEDWVPPTSILDVILVLHHEVGEATRNGRGYKDLRADGTFYLRAVYVPRSGNQLYGTLEALPLPELTDSEWPLPDMHTSEFFRRKLAVDIAAAMKGSTGSRAVHVHWFMPVHVMVDLFACADSVRKTRSMYIFNNPSEELLSSLMSLGWDVKYEKGRDVLKCVVSHDSIKFRYHLGRQMLYVNYQYLRYRCVEGDAWTAIDQAVAVEMVRTSVILGESLLPAIEVGRTWPVSHLRNEISIILSRDSLPEEYDLVIQRPGQPDTKVQSQVQLVGNGHCSINQRLYVQKALLNLILHANVVQLNGRHEKMTLIGAVLADHGQFKMVVV